MLRLLHTSDWHLGHNLFHKDRRQEHGLFLDWLLEVISETETDALLVSGDIFDTVAPPHYALTLYYDFLHRLAATPCRQAVIIGGNHDSAAFLHAPRELLRLFNVHVVGTPNRDCPESDVIVLRDRSGKAAGVVGAVPFLRERDVRRAVAAETYQEKSRAYTQGIADHYAAMAELCQRRIVELSGQANGLPTIATGHLMAAGGETSAGEREVVVGTLGGIPAHAFSVGYDYLALGHLHKAQAVNGPGGVIRYSGSPLPLSFSEAQAPKEVLLVTFEGGEPAPRIAPLAVPCFQALTTVRGDWQVLEAFFGGLGDSGPSLWLEVQLEIDAWGPGVQERVAALAQGKAVEVLAVRNSRRLLPRLMEDDGPRQTLTALTPHEVFARRLAQSEGLGQEDRAGLAAMYQVVVDRALLALEGAVDEN